jgi:hypothetical protein
MASNFEELEKEVRSLGTREKAALARTLIEDLDASNDVDVEKIWIEEAEHRYRAYQSGELETIPGEEAMQRAREHVK